MKLQAASKNEIKRIAIGTGICDLILVAGMFVLSLLGIGTFDFAVILGILGGSAVAIGNFTVMCLTVQQAVNITEQKQMKTYIQGSYNGRLLLLAAWITAAFLVPCFNVIAATIPLLFPNLTIYYLRIKGNLVASSDRKNPSADA